MKKWILFSVLVVALASCKKDRPDEVTCAGDDERVVSPGNFARVKAGENFQITFVKGNNYSVRAIGCMADLDDLEFSIHTGDYLEIKYDEVKNNRGEVGLIVTLPLLATANLSGHAEGFIQGFGGDHHVLTTILSGETQCSVDGTPANVQIDLTGNSKLNILGNTISLYGTGTGNARLNAYDLAANDVDLSFSGAAKAYVSPINALFAEASGNSKIYYKGNPPTKNFITSGNGEIIREQ